MPEKATFKALIWDMGGVLVRNMHPEYRSQIAEPFGLTGRQFEDLFFGNEVARRASVGQATEPEVWAFVQHKLNIPAAQMPEVIAKFWQSDGFDEDLYQFIMALRPRYKVCLLSNAFFEARDRLKQSYPHFYDLFDEVIYSAEVGIAKPDTRIYELALQRLGVAAGEAIFVDDFIENVEAARAVGLGAVHFKNSLQARQELAALLG